MSVNSIQYFSDFNVNMHDLGISLKSKLLFSSYWWDLRFFIPNKQPDGADVVCGPHSQ